MKLLGPEMTGTVYQAIDQKQVEDPKILEMKSKGNVLVLTIAGNQNGKTVSWNIEVQTSPPTEFMSPGSPKGIQYHRSWVNSSDQFR